MNKEIKIPDGWRVLDSCVLVKKGDKFWNELSQNWVDIDPVFDGKDYVRLPSIVIRKIN